MNTSPLLLTFEDRGPPRILQGLSRDAPLWVRQVINLGASGHTYKGWFTKPRVLHAWLEQHAAALGERLVVFIDGSDVVWGGCTTFEEEYARIAAMHGNGRDQQGQPRPIIFSAELGCDFHVPTPPGCAATPAPPGWVLAQSALHASLGRWHNCDAEGAAPCYDPPSYRFLNSGAFVGPASSVRAMLSAVLRYPHAAVVNARNAKRDDGLALARYWLEQQGVIEQQQEQQQQGGGQSLHGGALSNERNGSQPVVVLDYDARLFLTLWRLRQGALLVDRDPEGGAEGAAAVAAEGAADASMSRDSATAATAGAQQAAATEARRSCRRLPGGCGGRAARVRRRGVSNAVVSIRHGTVSSVAHAGGSNVPAAAEWVKAAPRRIRPAWRPDSTACFVHDNGAGIRGLGYNLMGVPTKPLAMGGLPRAWRQADTAAPAVASAAAEAIAAAAAEPGSAVAAPVSPLKTRPRASSRPLEPRAMRRAGAGRYTAPSVHAFVNGSVASSTAEEEEEKDEEEEEEEGQQQRQQQWRRQQQQQQRGGRRRTRRRRPSAPRATKAGLLHIHLGGAWPAYVRFVARSAAAHAAAVTFYFLGPPPSRAASAACAAPPLGNCVWLPLDAAELHARMQTHLGLAVGSVRLELADGRKLCDLKPMWAALFPELSSRHAWVGYADNDIVWGNLTAEVAALSDDDDELLTPSNYFPSPQHRQTDWPSWRWCHGWLPPRSPLSGSEGSRPSCPLVRRGVAPQVPPRPCRLILPPKSPLSFVSPRA